MSVLRPSWSTDFIHRLPLFNEGQSSGREGITEILGGTGTHVTQRPLRKTRRRFLRWPEAVSGVARDVALATLSQPVPDKPDVGEKNVHAFSFMKGEHSP